MINFNKLHRDDFSDALINTDGDAYRKHIHDVNQTRNIQKALNEVRSVKSDVDQIKEMLTTLMNGLNKNG